MKYTTPPSVAFKKEVIVPSRWGDEFDKEEEIITVPLSNVLSTIGINIWYDSDKELLVNYITRSGRVYQSIEKDMVKGKEVAKKVHKRE